MKGTWRCFLRRCVVVCAVLTCGLVPVRAGADADGDFAFARHLLEDRMFDIASQELQEFIDNHPNHPSTPDAFLLLANAHIERGAFSRAADTFQGFIIKYPQDVRVRQIWLRTADLRAQGGQHTEAARAYLDLAESYSESDFADNALAGAAASLIVLGENQRAEGVLNRLLEAYPTGDAVPKGRVLLARVLLARNDAPGAQQILTPLVRSNNINTDIADGLLLGTRAALAQNQVAEARRLSTRMVRQAPGDERSWNARMLMAGYLFEQGSAAGNTEFLNQAADIYKEVSRRASSAPIAEKGLFRLAMVREYQGSHPLALSNWRAFLDQHPGSSRRPRAMLGLGRAHLANGDDREGIFALEELLSAYPDSSEAADGLGALGDYYLSRNDALSAIAYFTRQLEKTRGEPERRALRLKIAGVRENALGEYGNARRIYEELADGDDDVAAQALFGLGRCFRMLGSIDPSEDAYHGVVQRFPNHSLAPAARDSLTMIELFLRPDVDGAFLDLISLQSRQLITQSDPATTSRESRLALARIRIDKLKDYEGAIALLTAYLGDQSSESPHEGEHLLARCYFRLSTKARLEHRMDAAADNRRLALEALSRLATRYPESSLADDAFIETTEARLAGLEPEEQARQAIEAYRGFLTRYTGSDRRSFVLVRIGESILLLSRSGGTGSPDEALARFNEALQVAPNIPELDRALFGSAEILAQHGRGADAKTQLERLIAERPLSPLVPESRFRLAGILQEQNEPRAAARELEKLLRDRRMSRDLNEVRRQLVVCYEQVGDYTKVIEVCTAMVASASPEAASWGARHLASAYLQTQRPDMAETVLARELEARPQAQDCDSLALLRARLLVEARRLQRVAPVLSAFERTYPASRFVPEAWRMLADVQFDLGVYQEALANYRRALQARSNDRAALMGEIVSIYRLGRAPEAQVKERSLRDMGPLTAEDEVRLAIERGYALFRGRDFDGAIVAFSQVVEQNPESDWADDALLAQGKVAAASGRLEPAVQAFERLMRTYPSSTLCQEAAFELGNVYLRSQYFEQAVDAFNRALEQDTTSRFVPDAMWNMTLSYENMQRFDSAVRTMRSFISRFPDHERIPRLHTKIGLDLNRLGEFRSAITAFEIALELVSGEDEAEVRFNMGEAYFMMGNYQQAVVEWLKLAYHSQSQSDFAVTARYRAAMANERMGQYDDARRLYGQIITSRGPNSGMGRAAAMRMMALDDTSRSAQQTQPAAGGNGQ